MTKFIFFFEKKTKAAKKTQKTLEKGVRTIYNIYNFLIFISDSGKIDLKNNLEEVKGMLSLYDAGSYFIHLYDKIGGVFGCSQIKLEKMLILAQIHYYINSNKNLIDDIDIVFAQECGFSLKTKNTYFRSPISTFSVYVDKPLADELVEKLDKEKNSSIMYFSEDSIAPELAEFLKSIFVKYASFRAGSLGELLDKIKQSDRFVQMQHLNNKFPFEIPLDEFYEMVKDTNFSSEINHG